MHKCAPLAVCVHDNQREVVYLVSSALEVSNTMREMFADLEQQKTSVGVTGIGVTVTTLEDIVVRSVERLLVPVTCSYLFVRIMEVKQFAMSVRVLDLNIVLSIVYIYAGWIRGNSLEDQESTQILNP